MFKLLIALEKEFLLLVKDKVGIALLFVMPIILVITITAIQNNTFKMVNENTTRLLICNRDSGQLSSKLLHTMDSLKLFQSYFISPATSLENLNDSMKLHDAMITLLIPERFSVSLQRNIDRKVAGSLEGFGIQNQVTKSEHLERTEIKTYYHPVLQESYRISMLGTFNSLVAMTENQLMVENIYKAINGEQKTTKPVDLSERGIVVQEGVAGYTDKNSVPNATQHNVPAWTIFAMFFMVVSLGGSIVKEKLRGSFIRLKILPTSYFINILAKQLTYLFISIAMVFVIFSIGKFVFPYLDLPGLNIPSNLIGLLTLTIITGWCAVSYALCVGVFSQTQEQCSGFGAVSIVILAAVGGVFVPSFAMPASFELIMKSTPFYWSLRSFYDLFLENKGITDIGLNLIPLLLFIILFQAAAYIGLKRKNLI
ncbi:MAG: ABC transporter permease [Flavobacteriales bacterium]|nr:ABC transporter permease [Flavobacteriales bacterium]